MPGAHGAERPKCILLWTRNLPAILVGMQTGAATMKKSVEALKALKTDLLYDPAIPPLAIYQGKTLIQKDTCTFHVHSSTPYNSQDMEAI